MGREVVKNDGTTENDPAQEKRMDIWSRIECIRLFVIDNFLVVGFSCAAIFALSYPYPGKYLGLLKFGPKGNEFSAIELINNICVFLVSGLSLKTDDLRALAKYWTIIIYGIVTINFITTLVAFIMIRLPFPTREFSVGFSIFSSVPTTLGVGVALTLQAKGDQALSLLMTVGSNMLGIVTIPYLLFMYLGSGDVVAIDPSHLALKLVYAVLIPTVVGISARKFSKTVASFMVTHKIAMGLFSNSNLICIVWMALSKSQKSILSQSGGEIVCIIVVAVIQHCFYLGYNYLIVSLLLKVPLKQAISITIMASQKSSPVALAVISNITASSHNKGKSGLFALPCVIGQLCQIFIGSLVAKHFGKQMELLQKFEDSKATEDSKHTYEPIEHQTQEIVSIEIGEVVSDGNEVSL